jgi:hypothetical protein
MQQMHKLGRRGCHSHRCSPHKASTLSTVGRLGVSKPVEAQLLLHGKLTLHWHKGGGADFHVEYYPGTPDLHWLQVIHTNFPYGNQPRLSYHGGSSWFYIDNDGTPPGNPFYDYTPPGGTVAAGPTFFHDSPRRGFTQDLFWIAYTFPALGDPDNHSLLIADACIQWGWVMSGGEIGDGGITRDRIELSSVPEPRGFYLSSLLMLLFLFAFRLMCRSKTLKNSNSLGHIGLLSLAIGSLQRQSRQ